MADDMLLLLLSDELSLSPRAVDWLDAAAAVGVGWWQPPFSDDELGLGFLLPEPASAPRPEALAPPAPGEHGDAAAAAPRQHEGVAWSAEPQSRFSPPCVDCIPTHPVVGGERRAPRSATSGDRFREDGGDVSPWSMA